MAQRIPVQRTETAVLPDVTRPTACTVEGCTDAGSRRFFPHYTATLCTLHFVQWADRLRAGNSYFGQDGAA